MVTHPFSSRDTVTLPLLLVTSNILNASPQQKSRSQPKDVAFGANEQSAKSSAALFTPEPAPVTVVSA
jgi:hypothetical protein